MVDFSGLRVKLLHEGAKLPIKGSFGAAGYDLVSPDIFCIPAGGHILLNLGIATEMPHNVFGRILDRSGVANKGVITMGGVIDNDYRGEWKVILHNLNIEDDYLGEEGDRVAQVVFMHYLTLPVNIVDELQDSLRSESGFGSTGR